MPASMRVPRQAIALAAGLAAVLAGCSQAGGELVLIVGNESPTATLMEVHYGSQRVVTQELAGSDSGGDYWTVDERAWPDASVLVTATAGGEEATQRLEVQGKTWALVVHSERGLRIEAFDTEPEFG